MAGSNIGVIGMAVMGQNIALNIESRGHTVSVYNRAGSKTGDFVEERTEDRDMVSSYDLEEFVESFDRPRAIVLMVQVGKPVDIFIDKLISLLDVGDVLIDRGNSNFHDTEWGE